jgi:hypothetical protein
VKTTVEEFFSQETQKALAFLVEEFGFVLAFAEPSRVVYASSTFSVRTYHNSLALEVDTGISAIICEREVTAWLPCLCVAAGLGPAQRVKRSARSVRTLKLALASQATAVRTLIPIVRGETGSRLLLECHGR